MSQKRRRKNRGSTLLFALLTLLLIGGLAAGFLALVAAQQAALVREHKATVARNLAEAGLELAAVKLSRDDRYRGEREVPLGRGTFDLIVKRVGEEYLITATGRVPTVGEARLERTVRVRARRTEGGVEWMPDTWQELPAR
ncbi:MAG TPA: hypothetical protein EYP85_17215 [Armatimonadetes bacterium]|nr:hypothetical protein [Armatimonadota bacterium]